MATPITFPPIQNGVYYISTLYPEFYLELQRDSTLKAMKLNMYSDAQKWHIIPVEDGTYQITCVQGNHELPCETYHAHNRQAHHKTQLWTIDPRGTSFIIGNAHDFRVLDFFMDSKVGFSERDNVRGQRWVIYPVNPRDDTLALRTQMAAMQPYTSPGAPDSHHPKNLDPRHDQGRKSCPLANPSRVRKTPVTEGVVREGIYRIISAIRKNDSVGFLELQRDGTIRAVPLNEASIGQRWEFTYYQKNKYYIKSSLNSRVLAFRPSAADPNVTVAVGDDSFPVPWTVEPRHDAYFIGLADDEQVLDLAENDIVVSEKLNGCTTQQWDLDPVRLQYQPAFQEGMRYLIRNHVTGRVIWLTGGRLQAYGHDDGDATLYFTFKKQDDGGTAIHSVGQDIWIAAELRTSTTEYSYRFIPAKAGGKFYYISPDMMSSPPKVMQDIDNNITTDILYDNNERQMWELVPKTG